MQQHLVTIEQMAVMTEVARTRPALAVHDERAGFRVLAAKLVESHDARITTKAARQAQGALSG